LTFLTHSLVWLGGVMVGCRTCDQHVAGSNPVRLTFGCNPGEVVHTRVSAAKQYKLVSAQAWKVTVGLASHWPCVRHSGLSTYGLNGLRQGDEPMFLRRRVTFPCLFTHSLLRFTNSPSMARWALLVRSRWGAGNHFSL